MYDVSFRSVGVKKFNIYEAEKLFNFFKLY